MGVPPVLHRLTVVRRSRAVFARRSNMSVVPQCPPVPAPSMAAAGLLDSWLDGCAAAVDGFGKVLGRDRPARPRRARSSRVGSRSPAGGGRHPGPHRTRSCSRARSRGCATSRSRRRRVVPTLVLPPQAGHDSCIVDYSAEQSQMRNDPRGRPRAGALARLGRRDERDRGCDGRGLHRPRRPRRRPLRRARQPDRRLPGRLARDDLRRAPSRARSTRSRSRARRSTSTPASR